MMSKYTFVCCGKVTWMSKHVEQTANQCIRYDWFRH